MIVYFQGGNFMDINFLLAQTLNSMQYGLILFLIASGLTLIFGIMGIINLAHGAFYMLGAYLLYATIGMTANFAISILVSIVIGAIIGFLLEWLLISKMYDKNHLFQVLMTFALILIFEDLRSIAFGDDVHAVSVPLLLSGTITLTDNMTYPIYRLFISLVCIFIALGLWFLINKTKLGMYIRAGAENRDIIQALGINIKVLYRIVFSLGAAMAVFAGALYAPVSTVYPGMGNTILIISFIIVIIGGIGSIAGAFIAALLLGFIDTFGKVYFPGFAGILIYVFMAVILLIKPEGLFGKKGK